ncbi:hypothetical protein AB838_07260 [Rhodobacteraceae bacterium (ex Bugula neritina AB1)]|nr:hypothetical protein AB838_07260 [Rhodobacteraceae bacterium (ex Bugula neritina AB1)]
MIFVCTSGCDVLSAGRTSHLQRSLKIGQIAVGCSLAYGDFCRPETSWRQGKALLNNQFAAVDSRPAMQVPKSLKS